LKSSESLDRELVVIDDDVVVDVVFDIVELELERDGGTKDVNATDVLADTAMTINNEAYRFFIIEFVFFRAITLQGCNDDDDDDNNNDTRWENGSNHQL
jgi:hypothetical protein